MGKIAIAGMMLGLLALSSCANTARGMTKDAGQTAGAIQDSTNGVLKAGAKGNKAAQ